MKILLISSYIFGYMEHLKPAFAENGIEAEFLYHGKPPLNFEYKNKAKHLIAFLKKAVGMNAKMEFRHNTIKEYVRGKKYDQILVVHPQYLSHKTHILLKSITGRYITFLFDSMAKMPRQRPVLKHFDAIFSYEKNDCKQYDFQFQTNFIPISLPRKTVPENTKQDFFNICSLDSRFNDLEAIGKALKEKNLEYEFLVFSNKPKHSPYVDFISKKIDSVNVQQKIQEARGLVDVQRKDQQGLSFRVFESLGYGKKLLTTNADIANYDFYHPSNILIVDPNSIRISSEFFDLPYTEVPLPVKQKYEPINWVTQVFNL